MEAWTFFGRVLPERVPISISEPLSMACVFEEANFLINCTIAIADSQVIANVSVNSGETDIMTLRNAVVGCVRPVVDLIGYLHGISFDVEIVSVASRETNAVIVFGIGIPAVTELRKPESLGKLDASLLQSVASQPHAQMALADFRMAMRLPEGTGFFCYRALEAMMQSMKVNDKEGDNAAWERLRENLWVTREKLDSVKRHSDLPRHGKISNISDSQRADVFMITDEVVRRFIQYITRGCIALPEGEFPPY
jgi:hypothetical protein